MNRNQTADLLSAIASLDQRTVGETDVEAWFEILGDLHYLDAIDAVKEHYKTSIDRIRPFHVRDLVRRAANDRIERASVSVAYRDQREATQDERLAELLGGSRSALGISAGRSVPASQSARAAAMAQVANISRRETSREKAARLHREYQAETNGGRAAA
ncbi:hypothetical protein [Nocardia terpenica]|uniref:Uncharacterized protein n=1 Tax=Nocardia terpenica TaxID=455432 RepID=A0A6G9YVR2_9NOCA|nr:hypothetical protein [Nocardia terpenica]QIS17308.1 hypothetical protein F6W96_02260 [Nocardia terpenica]